MKKTLVAIAALASVSAFAQSTVTLYGVADVAYVTKTHTNLNGSIAAKTSGIGEGFNAGNRIGFRGTEDLGGGMKANFVIENGINITNGQLFSTRAAASGQQIDGYGSASGNMPTGSYGTGTNRQSYVGASGDFGEIRLGYQYTNMYQTSTLRGFHLAAEQPGGDIAHGIISNSSYGGTRANGITYITPTMNGINAHLQMGAGTGRESVEATAPADGMTTNKNNRSGIMLNFDQGPLSASFAYTSMKIEQAATVISVQDSAGTYTTAGTTNIFGATASIASVTAAKSQSNKVTQLGGSYKAGALKFIGAMSNGTINDSTTATNSQKTKSSTVGAEYSMGGMRPFVQVGSGTVTTTSTGAVANQFKLQQMGVRYDLSKRTTVYAISGVTKDNAVTTAASLQKRDATAVGLAHAF